MAPYLVLTFQYERLQMSQNNSIVEYALPPARYHGVNFILLSPIVDYKIKWSHKPRPLEKEFP